MVCYVKKAHFNKKNNVLYTHTECSIAYARAVLKIYKQIIKLKSLTLSFWVDATCHKRVTKIDSTIMDVYMYKINKIK